MQRARKSAREDGEAPSIPPYRKCDVEIHLAMLKRQNSRIACALEHMLQEDAADNNLTATESVLDVVTFH
jgi:hypothetical protein